MLLYNIFIFNPFLPRWTVGEEIKKEDSPIPVYVSFVLLLLFYHKPSFCIFKYILWKCSKVLCKKKKGVPKYAALLDFLSVLHCRFFNMFIFSRFTLNFSYCISEGDNVCCLIMQ